MYNSDMSKEKETIQKEEQKQTKKDDQLLDDFKKEVLTREKKNYLAIFGYSVLVIVIFSLLGLASYQIFFKPEAVEVKESSEKIESRPVETTQPQEEKKEEVAQQNTNQTPAENTEPTSTDYTVQEGDTWSSIANTNGMTSAELMKYNNSSSEDLQIGQVIKIPKNLE